MRALILSLVLACDAGAKLPPPPPISNTVQPPVQATDDLVAAALRRVQTDPKSLLDAGLVGTNVYVMIEPGTAKRALPRPYVAMTRTELDAAADRVGRNVGFIHIYSVDVKGNTATLTIGGDVAMPTKDRDRKLCCCESTDDWSYKAGAWVFSVSEGGVCS